MEDYVPPQTFDLEVKAWTETFQATQRRTRTGMLLCTLATCIVLLMVFNLFESRKLRSVESISGNKESSEYMKEFSRHVADESYYQLPSLGMQITCDNVGLFGPLALLVFSLYSVLAFKAFDCQIGCGTRFPKSDLIRTLLETSQFEKVFSVPLKCLLVLPSVACLFVIWYVSVAHFKSPLPGDPLNAIRDKTLTEARVLDFLGLLCTAMVVLLNRQACKFFGKSQKKIENNLTAPQLQQGAAA